MAIQYLKKSPKTSSTDDTKTREIVENILKDIEKTKEEGCIELSKKFDKYEGEVVVTREKIEQLRFLDNNVTVNVNMETGETSAEQRGGRDISETGKLVAAAVQAELQRQKRPGGILSPYGAS